MALDSISRRGLLLLVIGIVHSAQAQTPIPQELRDLPPWSGEQNAAKISPPHYVFRDGNGQIVVAYPHPENSSRIITYRFWLPNRVDPHIAEVIKKEDDAGRPVYSYGYDLRNGSSAALPIAHWSLVGPAREDISVSHPSWKGTNARDPVAPQGLLPNIPNGAFLFWMEANGHRLAPGEELGGFTLRSRLSPGLTTGYASDGGILEEPSTGEFPEKAIEEITPLQRAYVWQKPFLAIGPRFAPGTPLPVVINEFKKDIASLIELGMVSAGSPFMRELAATLTGNITVEKMFARKATPQTETEQKLDAALKASMLPYK